MLEIIREFLTVILCLTGIASLLWYAFCRTMCEKDCKEIFTVVCCKNHSDLPDKVYSGLMLSRYHPLGRRDIIVVDTGIPEHIKILCEACAENLGTVYFISHKEVSEIFGNKH